MLSVLVRTGREPGRKIEHSASSCNPGAKNWEKERGGASRGTQQEHPPEEGVTKAPPGFFFYHHFPHYFKKCISNQRITAIQYCVSFCHTRTWVSPKYTHVPALLTLPPTTAPRPHHPTHVERHRRPGWASCVIQQLPASYLLCMR